MTAEDQLAGLDDVIAEARAMLAVAPTSGAGTAELLGCLASGLLDRYESSAGRPSDQRSSDLDEAVCCAERLLACWPPEFGDRGDALFLAATARYHRLFIHEDMADLDAAISYLTEAAGGKLDGDPDAIPLDVLMLLGELLALRFHAETVTAPGQDRDLSGAIRVHTLVVRRLADDEPARQGWMADLGSLYYDRYRVGRRSGLAGGAAADLAGDLGRAVTCFRDARDGSPADPQIAAEASARLGLTMAERALCWGNDPADVTGAIQALTDADQLVPTEDERLQVIQVYRGVMLAVRFAMHGGGPEDRVNGVAALRGVLAGPGADRIPDVGNLARIWLSQLLLLAPQARQPSPGRPFPSIGLAEAVRLAGYVYTDEARADAEEVIRHVGAIDTADPDVKPLIPALLGCALLRRGVNGLLDADLDRIISLFTAALSETPPSASGALEIRAVHAWATAERARRPNRTADLDPAAQCLATARDLLPADHGLRPVILHYLGLILCVRGRVRFSQADMSTGIAALVQALERMPAGHAIRAETLATLASAMLSAGQFDRASLPLDSVIDMLAETRSIPHPDAAKRAAYLLASGAALHIRASRDRSRADAAAASGMLKQAAREVGADDPLYPALLFNLASMLADDYKIMGNLESLQAASYYLDILVPLLETAGGPAYDYAAGVDLCLARAIRGSVRLDRALYGAGVADPDGAVADLRFALTELPPEYPLRSRLAGQLAMARLMRAGNSADHAGVVAVLPELLQAAEDTLAGSPDRAALVGWAGVMCVTHGRAFGDPALIDRGIVLLTAGVQDSTLPEPDRMRLLFGLGSGLIHRYELRLARADLDLGIEKLEQARDAFRGERGTPALPVVLSRLARAYHRRARHGLVIRRADPRRADIRRAVESGLDALREQAAQVLLQTGTERAVASGRVGQAQATEIAYWALAHGGDGVAAVGALELGRGLTLHAATVTADVPRLLADAGHPGLAEEWKEAHMAGDGPAGQAPWERSDTNDAPGPGYESGSPELDAMFGDMPGIAVPSDLRHRVLAALADSALDRALLSPPGLADIAGAMLATGTDAIVYLLPRGDEAPARAVFVWPDATVTSHALPGLSTSEDSPVFAYGRAHDAYIKAQDGQGEPAGPAAGGSEVAVARQRWEAALSELCDWAWRTAMVKVLTEVGARQTGSGPPNVVLIPFGMLGVVPWHAARASPEAERSHYACHDAVFSYAASARQLAGMAERGMMPTGAGAVFVAPRAPREIWPELEARSIRNTYYPDSRYLGARPPDDATPDQVLGSLPSEDSAGAALVHLSCHARAAGSAAASHLRLNGEQQLAVDRILQQALRRRPGLPGGTVILSACVSDLSLGDYDEALTLATAFAAAGVASVVGTKWLVPDVRSAIVMFMFHHYLVGGQPAAYALRLAQLWMLDPGHEIPAEMPQLLAQEVPRAELAQLAAWAGFIHQGL